MRSMYSADMFKGLITESSIKFRLSMTARSLPSNRSTRALSARRPCWRAVATRIISSCSRSFRCASCSSSSGRSKTAAPLDGIRAEPTLRPLPVCFAISLLLIFATTLVMRFQNAGETAFPTASTTIARGDRQRFTQPVVTVLRQRRAVPEVDRPDIAGAHLLQCRQKFRLISAGCRCDQQGSVASEEHALSPVVEADGVAAVTRRVDHLEILVAHFKRVPIAHQAIDAIGVR